MIPRTPSNIVYNIMVASMLHQSYYVISIIYDKDFRIKKKKYTEFSLSKFKKVYESIKMSLYSPVTAAAEPSGRDNTK